MRCSWTRKTDDSCAGLGTDDAENTLPDRSAQTESRVGDAAESLWTLSHARTRHVKRNPPQNTRQEEMWSSRWLMGTWARGKDGGPEVALEDHRRGEVLRFLASGSHRAGILQRTPGLGRHPKHGSLSRRMGTSCTSGGNQTPTTARGLRPFARTRGSGTGIPKSRRIKIQDLVEHHSLILCGAHGFARESSAMESAQQCFFLNRDRLGKRKGTVSIVPMFDGPSRMNPRTQRLIENWRRRRQGA